MKSPLFKVVPVFAGLHVLALFCLALPPKAKATLTITRTAVQTKPLPALSATALSVTALSVTALSVTEAQTGTEPGIVPAQPVPPEAVPVISSGASSTGFSVYSGYVLGAGDRITMSFFNVPEYDGQRAIAVDGSLTLPLVGKLPVAGLTLEAATQYISSAYSRYLRTPLITVDLVSPRPVQVGISGEVNQPGAYEVPLASEEGGALQWPTVVEALKLAGGITNQADIREVEIRRPQAGKVESIRLDLWEILRTGSVQNDITLRSGDAINIPTATTLSPEELTQLSAANFSPNAIKVTVVGEVPTPGPLEVEPNAPLNQALLAAGGFDRRRADTGSVELIRLNPDGTVTQREIPIEFDQGINETTNPSLQDNDVIVVGRSGQAAFSDTADSFLGPFGSVLSPFRLLLDLFD